MSYEMVVGLKVKDDKTYSKYRQDMKPLLERVDGGFRYDFKISEVLKNDEQNPINRVFVIFFGNKSKMDSFFLNPEYLKIKEKYFESSVEATTIISEYNKD